MKRAFALVLFVLMITANAKIVRVKGYIKKNGKYVSGHIKSSPDKIKANNLKRKR